MKHVAKGWRDMFVSANTNDQTGSSIQDRLKSKDGLWRDTIQNAVAVISSTDVYTPLLPTLDNESDSKLRTKASFFY